MMLPETLLREVPTILLNEITMGQSSIYGSIIRNVATGQIRGFLQESGGLNQVVDAALQAAPGKRVGLAGNAPGIGSAVQAVGFAVTGFQNEQIKAAVATLHTLQVANLALGAVGIGVSVAGFAVLNAKISRLEHKVDGLGERLDRIARGVEALRQEPIRQDFTRLRTATKLLDEGWDLADPVRQWSNVAVDATGLAHSFERRAGELFDGGEADPLTVEPFLEALALAIATRVSARLAAGDDLAARRAAADGTAALVRLGGRIRLGEAAMARIGHDVPAGTPEWRGALDAATTALGPVVDGIRQREMAAESTTETLGELERQRIGGRAWLEAARAETAQPLLCLLPAAG